MHFIHALFLFTVYLCACSTAHIIRCFPTFCHWHLTMVYLCYCGGVLGLERQAVINVTEMTTPSNVADRLIKQMSWTAGHTYVPLGGKKLVCVLDGIHKVDDEYQTLSH